MLVGGQSQINYGYQKFFKIPAHLKTKNRQPGFHKCLKSAGSPKCTSFYFLPTAMDCNRSEIPAISDPDGATTKIHPEQNFNGTFTHSTQAYSYFSGIANSSCIFIITNPPCPLQERLLVKNSCEYEFLPFIGKKVLVIAGWPKNV